MLISKFQVFSRVMAPISAIMHHQGFRMVRYLGDWSIPGPTAAEVSRARVFLLDLCHQLGIRVNPERSSLVLSQTASYLGMEIKSVPSRAFLMRERLLKLSKHLEEFLSSQSQPV